MKFFEIYDEPKTSIGICKNCKSQRNKQLVTFYERTQCAECWINYFQKMIRICGRNA